MWGGGSDVNYMLMLMWVCPNQNGYEMSFTLWSQFKRDTWNRKQPKNEHRNEQKHLQLLTQTVKKAISDFQNKGIPVSLSYHFY